MTTRIAGRNRYLIRKAIAHAIPVIECLEETPEDLVALQELLFALNGDSWTRVDESICWQMAAGSLVRDAEQSTRPRPAPTLKVVPIMPPTAP